MPTLHRHRPTRQPHPLRHRRAALCPWQQNLYAPEAPTSRHSRRRQFRASVSKDCKVRQGRPLHTGDPRAPSRHHRRRRSRRRSLPEPERRDDSVAAPTRPRRPQSHPRRGHAGRARSTRSAVFPKPRCSKQCRFVANTDPVATRAPLPATRRRNSGVFSANFDQIVCPYLPICDPVVNGKIVRFDASHLTAPSPNTIAPQVDALPQTNRAPSKP